MHETTEKFLWFLHFSVKWNGKISKPINNRYGVMQGGVLSPKLFNEFLQDLRKYLNPKYGLKIGDLYLAYLPICRRHSPLFRICGEPTGTNWIIL